jgi:hypothetical protein
VLYFDEKHQLKAYDDIQLGGHRRVQCDDAAERDRRRHRDDHADQRAAQLIGLDLAPGAGSRMTA